MAHHTHKLSNTTLEEDTCEILCLFLLLISDNTYCFFPDMEEISFPLAPHTVEAEQNLELQYELSTNIMTDHNKSNSDWEVQSR